ncbi:MAG: hypothetical protein NVS9B12_07660 [Vulcanimicrobiaceae bacterium]
MDFVRCAIVVSMLCTVPRAALARIDPCALITNAEAGQALGERVKHRPFGPSECLYDAVASESVRSLSVRLITPDDFALPVYDAKPAGGIGDKAKWATSGSAAALYVLKGSNALLINVQPEAMKGNVLLKFQPALTRLGKLAASRM